MVFNSCELFIEFNFVTEKYFILKVDTSRTQDISSYVYTCNMNSKEIIHIQDVVAKYSHQEQLVIYDFIKEIVE